MSLSKVRQCHECNKHIMWNDDVVIVEDGVYHVDCVTIVPTGFFVLSLSDVPIGETENGEGQTASLVLEDGEYIDLEDEK